MPLAILQGNSKDFILCMGYFSHITDTNPLLVTYTVTYIFKYIYNEDKFMAYLCTL